MDDYLVDHGVAAVVQKEADQIGDILRHYHPFRGEVGARYLDHVGIDAARRDRVDPDVIPVILARQTLGKAQHRVFRRRVDALQGIPRVGDHRADVDNRRGGGTLEVRQEFLRFLWLLV